MSRLTLVLRSLVHYRRTHLAALLGVATAVAVLGGALVVGDSVRASLRDLVLRRLGATTHALLEPAVLRRRPERARHRCSRAALCAPAP